MLLITESMKVIEANQITLNLFKNIETNLRYRPSKERTVHALKL